MNDFLGAALKYLVTMTVVIWLGWTLLVSGCSGLPVKDCCQRFKAKKNPNIYQYLCWYYPDFYIEWKIEGLNCEDYE